MNFDSFWLRLVEKRPELLDPNSTATLKSHQLKRLLAQSYESGRKNASGEPAGLPSLFKLIFG